MKYENSVLLLKISFIEENMHIAHTYMHLSASIGNVFREYFSEEKIGLLIDM